MATLITRIAVQCWLGRVVMHHQKHAPSGGARGGVQTTPSFSDDFFLALVDAANTSPAICRITTNL